MSNLSPRMPPGNGVTQRPDPKPAFSNDLFEQVLHPDNLRRAWRQVRANKGTAGIDGLSIDDFPAWAKSGGWETVKTEPRSGRYRPSPVRRVEIEVSVRPNTAFHWLSSQPIMMSPQVSKEVHHGLEAAHSGAVASAGRGLGT